MPDFLDSDTNSTHHLDPDYLRGLFDQDISLDEFCYHWLRAQCQTSEYLTQAVLLLRPADSHEYAPLAKWPLDANVANLADIAYGVLEEECGLLLEMDSAAQAIAAAYPVRLKGELRGIVALALHGAPLAELEKVMGQLQWSVAWLDLFYQGQIVDKFERSEQRSRSALELLAVVQGQAGSVASDMAFVTELAARLGCERVSLGVCTGRKVEVKALSHSSQFAKRMNRIQAIKHAMEEAVISSSPIVFNADNIEATQGSALVNASELSSIRGAASKLSAPDHARLAELNESASILSMPIFQAQKCCGVVTLERAKQFSGLDVDDVQALSALCLPTLNDKRLNERHLGKVLVDKARIQLARMVGENYTIRKLVLISSVALGVFFSVATGTYSVSADALLEGEIQQVVAAPYKGYIKSAFVKAGDRVEKDHVMAALDDRDLRLDRENWLSQRSQYRHQYNQALGEQDRSEMNISKAQMEQASAQLALAQSQLDRSQLLAPFSGTVISGDLSQKLGSFVEQGEILFEIAPLDVYRLILFVDERQVADLMQSQSGHLVLASLPNQEFSFQVSRITPTTIAQDGANYFRVEAELKATNKTQLRPGMEGVAKIDIGERKLIDIWTRALRHWLRLMLWKWLP